MKTAKLILTVVALFAVIGGTLAYKSSRIRVPLYSTNLIGNCIAPTSTFLTTQQQFPGQPIATITNAFYTTPVFGPCPLRTWYNAD